MLRFGGDDGPGWCLVDDAAPALMAVPVPAGDAVRAEWGYLALPDAEAPALAIYQDTSGAWLLEAGGATTPLEDRAVVSTADGALWRIHLPTGHERTVQGQAAPLSLADLTLRFACSRVEEHISLTATGRGRTLDLKAGRTTIRSSCSPAAASPTSARARRRPDRAPRRARATPRGGATRAGPRLTRERASPMTSARTARRPRLRERPRRGLVFT